MNIKTLVSFSCIYLMNCNSNDRGIRSSLVEDTLVQAKTSKQAERYQTPPFYKNFSNQRELLGIWMRDNKELLTVKIDLDSIYYIEHFESHKYTLKKDSIFINYHDYLFAAKLYFLKDTLIMESENELTTFYKFIE